MKMSVILAAMFLASASLAVADSQTPALNAARIKEQAAQCRELLKTSLVDFYLPNCLDVKNGGYMENLGPDGKFALTGEKFLTLQARHIWFFSALAQENIQRERALAAARHGFRFIHERFRDPQMGGYFSKVTDAGKPKDTRKHVYLNAFTLYAFAKYYGASHDPAALAAAKELFRELETHAHDKQFGGYIEFFNADWTEVTDAKSGGYVGAIGVKTYNSHLHLMEAMAELYRVWKDPKVLERLNELIDINTTTVLFPTVNANVDAWHRDWTVVNEPNNLRASYGHDIECLWLVIEAAKIAGRPPALYQSWAEKLAANLTKFGYDTEHGGLFESGPLNEPANQTRKTWWVQSEALVGFLELYQLSGDAERYKQFSQTLDFCAKYHVAKEGGWWATRNPDGSPADDKTRTSMWQGGYHAGRALIESAHRLEALSEKMRK